MSPRSRAYPPVKGSEFYKRKLRTCFRRLDFNGDGLLTVEDFRDIAEGMIKVNKLEGEKATWMRETLLKLWNSYFKPAGETKGIREEEYLSKFLSLVNDSMRDDVDAFGSIFFEVIDINGDGKISKAEYFNYNEVWHIGGNQGSIIFDIIDSDSDGLITKEEYLVALNDFYFNEDTKSPFKVLFGSLV